MHLNDLPTPTLILDRRRLDANLARMGDRMSALGVRLRPHLKTAKSAEIARRATAGHFGGITVSTVAEAHYFAARGFNDITYAIGCVPAKLDALAPLLKRGLTVQTLTDDAGAARALGARAAEHGIVLPLLIEIDCGLGRAGVAPDSPYLLEVASAIAASRSLRLEGVLTHAGHSYHVRGREAVRRIAAAEREALATAAARLRGAGFPCPGVSGGSTPTATFADDLAGVTEMRPGNYMFFDLDQVGIGVCRPEDIAVSVLASVIGHNRNRGTILIDAGALALSKDTSAGEFLPDAGYGWVCEAESLERIADARVAETHQEHGIVTAGTPLPFERLAIGSRVRVLPNHSCLTCAMYPRYYLTEGGAAVIGEWPRCNGW